MPSRFTRQEIWQHNELLGKAKFTEQAMLSITMSRTATREAKATATKIHTLCKQLGAELRKRDE